jgi:two-component system sensor histidine kinase CpxA
MKSLRAQLSVWSLAVLAMAALAVLSLERGGTSTPSPLASYKPFLVVLVVAIVALYSYVAREIASPISKLSETMERFGAGDLSVRADTARTDEIGRAAHSFNRMADRIEALVVAERRLIQDVSHELRAPLTRLRFAAELVQGSADQAAAVSRLTKEVDRLGELVGTLTTLARAEGDPEAYRPGSVNLGDLLTEITAACDSSGRQTELLIEHDVTVFGDPELLRRAIENILTNAMRYGYERPVQIRLATDEDTVRLTVRDCGPGVPAEALADIFKPFYRVEASRDRAQGGVGLGLAIAQRAVTLHRGRIWAENAQPGLRVTIELPVGRLAAEAQR